MFRSHHRRRRFDRLRHVSRLKSVLHLRRSNSLRSNSLSSRPRNRPVPFMSRRGIANRNSTAPTMNDAITLLVIVGSNPVMSIGLRMLERVDTTAVEGPTSGRRSDRRNGRQVSPRLNRPVRKLER
jgi:hypothetical protein